jgi:hypothetical protein
MLVLAWLAAPDGAAMYDIQRWLDYTGLSPEQARGWGWTRAVHRDDIDRLAGYLQTVLASDSISKLRSWPVGSISTRCPLAGQRTSDGVGRW